MVYLEELPVAEQVRTLASADVFITGHGSALGWMMLLPRGAMVLCVRGPSRVNGGGRGRPLAEKVW